MEGTYEPGVEAFVFPSQGDVLVGTFYAAGGNVPRPTCIFTHGLPGAEKNYDIAYALRDRGWNAVIWSPRGSWGSDGAYSLNGIGDDLLALIAFLRAGTRPIDWDRLVLLGYSLGGATTVQVAHGHPGLARALVLIAPLNDFLETSPSAEAVEASLPFLRGATLAGLQKEWMQQAWSSNPVDLIASVSIPTLVVHGDADAVVPLYTSEALAEAGPSCQLMQLAGADHEFNAHRSLLVRAVVEWLNETIES